MENTQIVLNALIIVLMFTFAILIAYDFCVGLVNLWDCQSQGLNSLPSKPNTEINNTLPYLKPVAKFVRVNTLQTKCLTIKTANNEVVNACNTIIKSFDVALRVEERKSTDVYTKRDINIKGHGAIDMMARMTNDAFVESAITPRSTQQFQDLFKGVEFSPTQKASAVQIKKIYDSLIHRAIAISREVEQSPGLKIVVTNSQGQQIETIGLAEKKHPNIFDDRKLDITVVENKSPYSKSQNKWIAIAPLFDEDGKPKLQSNGQQQSKHLGYISEACLQQY